MLATPHARGSSTLGVAATSRAKLAVPTTKQPVEQTQSAFKPRKVKKTTDSKYRDRAAERRDGEGNDYAHIDARRKYLGGDGEHSVLVKGLDFALLEQNKATTSRLTNDDVDALEQAFAESSHAESTATKKRTRQDLIEELKRQRAEQGGKSSPSPQIGIGGEGTRSSEQTGKFKPIGFKPISSTSTKKKKKSTMEGGDGEKKKKKRKIEQLSAETSSYSIAHPHIPPMVVEIPKEPEPIDEDFDIFTDAGEYEGIDVDGDSDEEPSQIRQEAQQQPQKDGDLDDGPRHWIPVDESIPALLKPEPTAKFPPPQPAPPADSDEDMQDERPVRLVPLESSALPSIKDLLAMDKASTSHDKNKKRKEKKKKKAAADDDDD
ncbi:hypothetical protein NLJ89_g4286 [Agrocybe chaxingu]|uniref:RED-like N-terminal domain-containing protein n=1 Tax=Agrocybe chaxingu TaxID=84603 RepID=A0A9W8K8X4_9AGAR|nr:hypothetical protein NLJ89_g4286 [Agrocybe chaxingu]